MHAAVSAIGGSERLGGSVLRGSGNAPRLGEVASPASADLGASDPCPRPAWAMASSHFGPLRGGSRGRGL